MHNGDTVRRSVDLLLNSAEPIVYSDDLTLAVTRNVAVPEWGATDATRITGSGGVYNYVCYVGGKAENIAYGKYIGESGKNYTISVYIKNNHSTNKCGVRINLPYDPGYTMIDPGATMKVVQTATGNGNVRLAIFFSTENVGEAFDFTIWHPMIETGTMPTDWTPAPEDTYAAIDATQTRDMTRFTSIRNTSLFPNTASGEITRVGKTVTFAFEGATIDALYANSQDIIGNVPSGLEPTSVITFAVFVRSSGIASTVIERGVVDPGGTIDLYTANAAASGALVSGSATWSIS